MKAKILIALSVAVLFGFSTMLVYFNGQATADSNVRICPNTGQPCTGEGLCGSGNGEPCGGGCCGEKATSEKAVPAEKTATSSCATCPNKANGTCPGK